MTEDEQFALVDAYEGNTMITFANKDIALRYALHRHETYGQVGIMVGVEDTRGGTGLFVMWRDRVPPEQVDERIANCRWQLEETLAGRLPWPVPNKVVEVYANAHSRAGGKRTTAERNIQDSGQGLDGRGRGGNNSRGTKKRNARTKENRTH